MNYDDALTLIIAYIASNIVGLLFLWAGYRNTKLARFLFVLLFSWASWINFTTARVSPEVYLEYSKKSLEIYSSFINGWFAGHITLFVTAIAIGQGLIALGMLLKGKWVTLACIGSILFLISIAPLGLYAAFPFSITVSVAAYFIIKRDDKSFLWKFFNQKLHSSRS
jgi:hypothetical protein